MTVPVRIKLLSPDAKPPVRGSADAAGSDLFACLPYMTVEIAPFGGRGLIPTGIAMDIPALYNVYARIAPRSGLAAKHGIDVLAGVVDADYRGQVGVVLVNHGDKVFEVKHGDRIAQIIFEQYAAPYFSVVEELTESSRGSAGFGSTGV